MKPSKEFKREGSDIFSNVQEQQHSRSAADAAPQVQVSYIDAILGTEVKVATLDGTIDLKIPAGSQPETVLGAVGRSCGVDESSCRS